MGQVGLIGVKMGTKTYLVVKTETNYGKPFKEVLIDLCEEYVTMAEVAKVLGMSRNTLWTLMSRYDLSWMSIRLEVLKREGGALRVVS